MQYNHHQVTRKIKRESIIRGGKNKINALYLLKTVNNSLATLTEQGGKRLHRNMNRPYYSKLSQGADSSARSSKSNISVSKRHKVTFVFKKNVEMSPGWCGSTDRVWAYGLKSHRFNS